MQVDLRMSGSQVCSMCLTISQLNYTDIDKLKRNTHLVKVMSTLVKTSADRDTSIPVSIHYGYMGTAHLAFQHKAYTKH